jgi:HJR/Mrr/RecB family endonuclease
MEDKKYYFYRNMEGSYTMTEQSEDYARDLKQGKAS